MPAPRKTSEIQASTTRVTRKFEEGLRRRTISAEDQQKAHTALTKAIAEIVERISPRGLIKSTDGKNSTTMQTFIKSMAMIHLGSRRINRMNHQSLIIWLCGFMHRVSARQLTRDINRGPKKKREALDPKQSQLGLTGGKMSETQRRVMLAEKACPLTTADKAQLLKVQTMLKSQGIDVMDQEPGQYWEWAARLESAPESSLIKQITRKELSTVPKSRQTEAQTEATDIFQALNKLENAPVSAARAAA